MGIDARGLAIWPTAVEQKLKSRIGIFATAFCGYPEPRWRSEAEMEINFYMDRYFGPGYERSQNTPNQTRYMKFLIEAGAEVYYGGDSSNVVMKVSTEYLNRMEEIFFYAFIHELAYYDHNIPQDLWDGVEYQSAIEYYPEDRP